MKKLILGVVAVAVLGFSQFTVAQQVWMNGLTIQNVLIDSVNYGGCMALTDRVLADAGLDCPSRYVTFSCDGSLGNDREIAFRQLDQAQVALVLKKKVNMVVDDSKKVNGYCYAQRIDLDEI